MLTAFDSKTIQESKALLVFCRRAGLHKVDQVLEQIEAELARYELEAGPPGEQPDGDGLCPSCGKGMLVNATVDGCVVRRCVFVSGCTRVRDFGCGYSTVVDYDGER